MTVHTVGDSHSYSGWSGVTTNHLGPMLCYTFGKKPKRFDIHSVNLTEGDTLIFVLVKLTAGVMSTSTSATT